MADDSLKRLAALLGGQAAARARLDPSLLADLLPVVPAASLLAVTAYLFAAGIGLRRRRALWARLMAALAERLDALPTFHIETFPSVAVEILPFAPERLRRRLAESGSKEAGPTEGEAAETVETPAEDLPPEEQAETFCALALRLPPKERSAMVDRALGCLERIEDESLRAWTLIDLTPCLQPLQFPDALRCLRTIRTARLQRPLLYNFAAHFPEHREEILMVRAPGLGWEPPLRMPAVDELQRRFQALAPAAQEALVRALLDRLLPRQESARAAPPARATEPAPEDVLSHGAPPGSVDEAMAEAAAEVVSGAVPPADVQTPPRESEETALALARPPAAGVKADSEAPSTQAGARTLRRAPRRPGTPPRVVSTGFSTAQRPLVAYRKDKPLISGQPYFFWLEVGRPVRGSIETKVAVLPTELLPKEAVLTVALYAYEPGVLMEWAETGELRLDTQGRALVLRQPGEEREAGELTQRRLLFPLRAPDRGGELRLRCSMYWGNVLVQSRLIVARLSTRPELRRGALRATVDYQLTRSLAPAHLRELGEQQLSLMVNANGDGTHSLQFFGGKGFKSDAILDGFELEKVIRLARGALRKAAWGDEEGWDEKKSYRYDRAAAPVPDLQLAADLIYLARRGRQFYSAVASLLAGGPNHRRELLELMRRPGQVQIAHKHSPRFLVPAALFYDYEGIDPDLPEQDYALCPSFTAALGGDAPLERTACFKGDCPSRGEERVVCPSGLWGFRHFLGLPASVAEDACAKLSCTAAPALLLAVAADPNFVLLAAHEQALRRIIAVIDPVARSRSQTLELLGSARCQIVYFYCHGGLEEGFPFIHVGDEDEPHITGAALLDRVHWESPRPLILINGCRTTAVEPEQAFELVSTFVREANAAGVIGTEITIFEPLACEFALAFLERLVTGRQTLGEAVRNARLALLKKGNPLGLVYDPFALPGLTMG